MKLIRIPSNWIKNTLRNQTLNFTPVSLFVSQREPLVHFCVPIDFPITPRLEQSHGESPYRAFRNIPDDETIVQVYQTIPNPSWKWVYGMMATYGLRNHEVFRCDPSDLELLYIQPDSKTGEHYAVAFPDEWIKLFNLEEPIILPLDLKRTNKALGNAITQQFKRYDISFSPYDLRHAWAIRTWKAGWPDSESAKAMGHDIQVHYRIYQRCTGNETRREIYTRLKAKKL